VRTDRPAATAGFTLSQDLGNEHPRAGVVIYQAIYRGMPATASDREAAALGVVFVALRLEDTLRAALEQAPRYLDICIVDTDPLAQRRRLSGREGCESRAAGLVHVRAMAFAGRQWDLRILANPLDLPGARSSNAWPFSVVGLMAAAVLSALLLTVTGRARRIELAVRERTGALTQQVREREQAEAAMRASEQRFRNVFNNVPLGVCYTDLEGNVKQANPRFCELVGYSAGELAHMTLADFTHPDDIQQDQLHVRQLICGEVPLVRRHKRYVCRAGRTVWVQTTVSLLRNEDGEPWRIVGAVEDITEHLRLGEAERAREAAEASNRAKSDFLSRMSHELRTPLNAMLGFAQLLELDRRHPIAEAQRPWVAQIQRAGWHLLEMINDVLDLSRIESGNLRLTVESLDIAELIESARTMVVGDAGRRGVTITQSLGGDASALRGDATRVKQILINLPVERGQVQRRGRAHSHRQPRRGRHGGDRGDRYRTGDDARAAPGAVPAVQPAGTRTHPAGGHRHRARDQQAAGRADGRQPARPQFRGRRLLVHPGPACRERAAADPLAGRRSRQRGRRLPSPHRPLRRGQRDQRRGDARHPGAAPAGGHERVGDRAGRPGCDPGAPARRGAAGHASARHRRPGPPAPPEARPDHHRDPGGGRVGRRDAVAGGGDLGGRCGTLPDQARERRELLPSDRFSTRPTRFG
jgi:PAS domain S-box-containing protein